MKRIRGHNRLFSTFLAAVLLLAALSACHAAAIVSPVPGAGTVHFYLDDTFLAEKLVPLDPVTLADRTGGNALPAMLVSADGSTGVAVETTAGRANPDPDRSWVVVHDLPRRTERGRFHPPVSGLAAGLSAGGERLLWQPFPLPPVYPPPVEWYVLDAAGGAVIGHVQDKDNACFRQSAILDPAGDRLYCVADPALGGAAGLQPLRIVAYDVAVGATVAELVLPDVAIGETAADNGTAWNLIEPAVALSPDGRTLAVVHAGADVITLIDAAAPAVERTIELDDQPNLLDLLGLRATAAHAKGIAAATIRHAAFSHDGRFLYIFSQQLRPDGEEAVAGRGLRVVDLARGRVTAEALPEHQIQWVMPAADGSVYAFGTTEERLGPHEIRESSPLMLWRLDGRTLELLAQRPFTGYRGGRLVPIRITSR